jgi:hypothetical protein
MPKFGLKAGFPSHNGKALKGKLVTHMADLAKSFLSTASFKKLAGGEIYESDQAWPGLGK